MIKMQVMIQKLLGLSFHHQGPIFINAYCQAATNLVIETEVGVMICLGQGGLRSASAFV